MGSDGRETKDSSLQQNIVKTIFNVTGKSEQADYPYAVTPVKIGCGEDCGYFLLNRKIQ